MKLTLTILDKKLKPFKTEEGEMRDYYWYKGERKDNEVSIRFGSTNPDHEIGDEIEIDIEKFERKDGKFGYKEINIFTGGAKD